MAPDSASGGADAGFTDQTVRQIIQASIGGKRVRVRLSNAYGTAPLEVGAADIALQSVAGSIAVGSDHALLFNGQRSIIIPAGGLALSDPVDFDVAACANLAVSVYFPTATGPTTWHQLGMQTAYVSPTGDFTAAAEIPGASSVTSRFVLASVEVAGAGESNSVVAFGDSITEGYRSTVDANHRWPDFLSQRLNANAGSSGIAVLNQGISGNRLLHDTIGPNASARFDRDVLAQSGVARVIVLEGINDIGLPGTLGRPAEEVSADAIIQALGQLIERAHDHKLLIFGGTLTPFEGTTFRGYYTPEGEIKRQTVNAWIRTSAHFDAVIDFDQAIRDPSHPTRMLPTYDSGDHLHPNDAGYRAMADSINLDLFKVHPTRLGVPGDIRHR